MVVIAGAAIAATGSFSGFLRAFGDGRMVRGMPISEMPEMFVAGAGILLVLVGALLRGAPRTPAATSGRFRRRWPVAFAAATALTIDVSRPPPSGS